MMYLMTQNWIYLLFAVLLGAVIAYLLNLCNCDKSGLEAERDGLLGERNDLIARLAVGAGAVIGGDGAIGGGAASAGYDRKIAGLEAELAEARVNADTLAAAAAQARASEPAMDNEDVAAMKWRNRYLEARVTFLEDQSEAAPIVAGFAGAAISATTANAETAKAEPVTNENFVPSSLASLSGEELEAATLAAAENAKAPPRSRKRANPDDLLLVDGVGPKNNAWLNEQGIYYFHQIATLNIEHVAWLAENLPTFGSRVYRENWVAQCTNLARGNAAKS